MIKGNLILEGKGKCRGFKVKLVYMNEILGTFMKIGKTAFSREYEEFEESKKKKHFGGRVFLEWDSPTYIRLERVTD